MADSVQCWKCGTDLAGVLTPLPRLAECPQCRAQWHVCRMCAFFDPSLGQQCREPIAENVADKTRANFCGYFQINDKAFAAKPDLAAESRRQLDTLFGQSPAPDQAEATTPAEAARRQLDDLFKK